MTSDRPTREELARRKGLPPDRITPQVMAGRRSGEEPPDCRSCSGPVVGPRVDLEARLCFSCLDKIDRGIIPDPRQPSLDDLGL